MVQHRKFFLGGVGLDVPNYVNPDFQQSLKHGLACFKVHYLYYFTVDFELFLFLSPRRERSPDSATPFTCAERCCDSASLWWTAMCSTDWEMLMLSRLVQQQILTCNTSIWSHYCFVSSKQHIFFIV